MDNEISLQKLPPQNIEAEQLVLAAIMLENDAIKNVVGLIFPEDFYPTKHQKIFSAMLEMHAKEDPIDLITLPEILGNAGVLESIGGASYLSYLVTLTPSAANIKRHAKIVKEKSSLRKLIHTANDMLAKAYSGELPSNDIAHDALQSVKGARSSGDIVIVKYNQLLQAGMDHIEKRCASKKSVYGVPTGIAELDDHTDGIYLGESWLVAARPGKGKTAFANSVARHAASEGIKVGMINLEMGEAQLGIRALSSKTAIPITMLRKGMVEDRHWSKITSAFEQMHGYPIFTCSTAFNLEQIERATDILVDDHGCELIVYDYLQLIRKGRKSKDQNREQEVAEVSGMIKRKAMQLKFAALPLAQLNRETEKRKDKKPQLSDLRESGALEQDADNVILIYHHECNCPWNVSCSCGNRNRVDFLIEKGRNSGPGVIQTEWDAFTTSFKGNTEVNQSNYRDRTGDAA